MITKWLHLTELGGDPWALPIWAAVNEAVKSGKVPALSDQVYRLGLHLSIRLNILPRVVQKVNSGTSLLLEATKAHGPEYVFTESEEGYAYPVDHDLKYSLLADIDALLFELNSACELMTRLFCLLRAHGTTWGTLVHTVLYSVVIFMPIIMHSENQRPQSSSENQRPQSSAFDF
jgi:hypothetical protein